jgi:SpoIIAA-like
MLEVLPAPDTVVALRASGRIGKDDVERAIQAVEDALARQERIALYAEIEIVGITPGAFARDLGYGVGKLGELRRFPRAAVVTSREWVRWIARVQDAVLPQIEIRTFPPAARDEALAWASQPLPPIEPEPPSTAPSVRPIGSATPGVIAFEVNGRIRSEDMRRVIAVSEEALKAHERLRVLVRVVNFDGVGLEALREEGLVAMKMKGLRQVERYALVGGPTWMKTVAGWSSPLVRTETRHFDLAQEEAAWRWLEAEPRGAQ